MTFPASTSTAPQEWLLRYDLTVITLLIQRTVSQVTQVTFSEFFFLPPHLPQLFFFFLRKAHYLICFRLLTLQSALLKQLEMKSFTLPDTEALASTELSEGNGLRPHRVRSFGEGGCSPGRCLLFSRSGSGSLNRQEQQVLSP